MFLWKGAKAPWISWKLLSLWLLSLPPSRTYHVLFLQVLGFLVIWGHFKFAVTSTQILFYMPLPGVSRLQYRRGRAPSAKDRGQGRSSPRRHHHQHHNNNNNRTNKEELNYKNVKQADDHEEGHEKKSDRMHPITKSRRMQIPPKLWSLIILLRKGHACSFCSAAPWKSPCPSEPM